MTDISKLETFLDWKLLDGSHKFPGPSGGTCINEAAIVAAGMEYRQVEDPDDCPPCFCPQLSAILIEINDTMPDDQRQKLMPFVVRLSGSKDHLAVERQRFDYVEFQFLTKLLAPMFRRMGATAMAAQLTNMLDADEAISTILESKYVDLSHKEWVDYGFRTGDMLCPTLRFDRPKKEEHVCPAYPSILFHLVGSIAKSLYDSGVLNVWDTVVDIVEGAFAIGNQADPIDVELVKQRFDKIKESAVADG